MSVMCKILCLVWKPISTGLEINQLHIMKKNTSHVYMSTKNKLTKSHTLMLYYRNHIYPGQNILESHSVYKGFSNLALLTFGLDNSVLSAFTVHCGILAAFLSCTCQSYLS